MRLLPYVAKALRRIAAGALLMYILAGSGAGLVYGPFSGNADCRAFQQHTNSVGYCLLWP